MVTTKWEIKNTLGLIETHRTVDLFKLSHNSHPNIQQKRKSLLTLQDSARNS